MHTWFDVHVYERLSVYVLEAVRHLFQNIFELSLRETRATTGMCFYFLGQTATIAELILNKQMPVLSPGRKVTHDMRVLAKHGVSIDLPTSHRSTNKIDLEVKW